MGVRAVRISIAMGVAGALAALGSVFTLEARQDPVAASPTAPHLSLVDDYCVSCHDETEKKGGLALDTVALQDVARNPDVWEKVVRKLRARQMPPVGRKDRPDEAIYDAVIASLETTLDRAAAAKPNPGRTATIRRLTRTEYQNAIRDLLALEIDVTSLLPADESSYGFDNVTVGDLSPTLLDRYVSAAEKISRLALGRPSRSPGGDTIRLRPDLTQEEHLDGLPLGTRGGALIHYAFPLDGEYDIQIRLMRDRDEHVEGLSEAHDLELLLDKARVQVFTVTPPPREAGPSGDQANHENIDRHLRIRVPVAAGTHAVGVAFVKKPSVLLETARQPYQAHFNFYRHPRVQPAVYSISIVGPYAPNGPGETPSRRRILVSRPANPGDEEDAAHRILTALMRRAYRRPVTAADLRGPLALYRQARADGDFDAGIEMALSAVLVSPAFLFRVEPDPPGVPPKTAYRVSDVELASRLSFFLWSSIPDDELLAVAIDGRLRQPAVLERQVARMLADARSRALVKNFASQWLHLRNLASITPDMRLFPDFDDNLRQAFRQETELFFDSVLREDRSVLELLRADYTFVNERLAKHYGIPHVYGSHFPRQEQRPRRAASPRKRADRDFVRDQDVPRGSRQMDSRQSAWRSSPAAAARRPGPERQHGRWEPLGAQATRRAPEQPDLRRVSQPYRSDWPVAREVRCGRPQAQRRRWPAHRCLRKLSRRQHIRRRRRPRSGAAAPAGVVRRRLRRKASDLCVGTRCRVLRRAGRTHDRAPGTGAGLPHLFDCPRSGQERAVSDEDVTMIITRQALPRRTFLRGLGASVALPLLDAMVPSMTAVAKTAADPVRRLGFIYMPMGCDLPRWTPPGEGRLVELSPTLQSLRPVMDQLTVISNLELKNAYPGTHATSNASFLSAAKAKWTESTDYHLGTTVDQVAARQIGHQTLLPSLELSMDLLQTVGQCDNGYACVYQNNLSWSSPTTPLPAEAHPRVVFERLFGEGGSAADRRAALRRRASLLDSVREDITRLETKLGPEDRTKVGQYLETVREVERRIQKAEAATADQPLPDLDRPEGVPAAYADHARLMFDLQVLALQGDVTRVITFQLARETSNRTYTEIGVSDPHHPLTHHGNDPEKIARMAKINAFHVSLFAYFLEKLKATPEGDGSLLDHSLLLYGSGMGNPNVHDHVNLPVLVAGGAAGRLKGARHIKYAEPTPLANLHLTLLERVGVRLDAFADSKGKVDELLSL
jgi:Protein of unknown function (DUF1552)/Protein of unknown function (DUF1592)/Protein of unknown function (DUF1587)/Protein of unknown function (DUF1595)/Planctomycete cytochrome C